MLLVCSLVWSHSCKSNFAHMGFSLQNNCGFLLLHKFMHFVLRQCSSWGTCSSPQQHWQHCLQLPGSADSQGESDASSPKSHCLWQCEFVAMPLSVDSCLLEVWQTLSEGTFKPGKWLLKLLFKYNTRLILCIQKPSTNNFIDTMTKHTVQPENPHPVTGSPTNFLSTCIDTSAHCGCGQTSEHQGQSLEAGQPSGDERAWGPDPLHQQPQEHHSSSPGHTDSLPQNHGMWWRGLCAAVGGSGEEWVGTCSTGGNGKSS